jgi:hypothetical protein
MRMKTAHNGKSQGSVQGSPGESQNYETRNEELVAKAKGGVKSITLQISWSDCQTGQRGCVTQIVYPHCPLSYYFLNRNSHTPNSLRDARRLAWSAKNFIAFVDATGLKPLSRFPVRPKLSLPDGVDGDHVRLFHSPEEERVWATEPYDWTHDAGGWGSVRGWEWFKFPVGLGFHFPSMRMNRPRTHLTLLSQDIELLERTVDLALKVLTPFED